MALTTTQQQDLLKLGVSAFNASIGVGYMNQLGPLLGTGNITVSFYDAIVATSIFQGQGFGFSAASTNDQFIAAYVAQLGMTGTAATTATTFAQGFLNTAGNTRGGLMKAATDFLSSAAGLADTVFGTAAATFQNKVTVATDFTVNQSGGTTSSTLLSLQATISSVTSDSASVTTAIATNSGASGQTFTLTTGVDAFKGLSGNDTFIGSNTTYTGLDTIDGGGGINTLVLSDVAGAALVLTNATVTNIQNLTLNSTLGLAGAAADLTKIGGLTAATLSLNAAAAGQTVTAASTTKLTIANPAAFSLDVVGGGAGALTISNGAAAVKVGQTSVVNAFTSATVTGGSTVAIRDVADTSATIGSVLKTVSLDGNTGTATLEGKGLTTLSLANSTAAATITNATAAHTLNLTVNAVTGGATITDATATTVNVSGVTKASNINLDVDVATALTVDAAVATTLTTTALAADDKLVTLTSKGAGGVTADVTGISSLTAVDASTSTGANTITIKSTQTTFAGGSGVDSVTVAEAPTKSIDGGAGTADVLTLNVIAGTFSNPSANTNVKGFEVLGLGTAADGSYDATGFTSLTHGAVAAAVTYANVAAGTGLTMTASPGFATTYTLKDATGTSDALSLTLKSAGAITGGTLTAAAIETVNITSTDTDTTAHTNTLTLAATSATKATLSGNTGFTLTNTGNVKLVTFDASGVTAGAVTYASAATSGAVTITGGAGADLLAGNTLVDTINGGAGNDSIASGTGLDILTGGAGNDTFTLVANANGNIYATITDATKGDILTFVDKGTEVFNSTKATLGGTAVFQDYLNLVAAGDGSTNGIIGWFQFSGDTYVVEDLSAGATFVNGTDVVVKLSGLVDLGTAGVVLAAVPTGVDLTINGTAGNDTIAQGASTLNLAVNGLGGNDTITTGTGNDVITTLAGDDTINAGSGNNTIDAGAGNNTITVTAGTNSITTLGGSDIITGGTGADTITSGAGIDTLTGGAGADSFVFVAGSAGTTTAAGGSLTANKDAIADFVSGTDKIVVGGAANLLGAALGGYTETAAAIVAVANNNIYVVNTGATAAGVGFANTLAEVYALFSAGGATALNSTGSMAVVGNHAILVTSQDATHSTGLADIWYVEEVNGVAGITAADHVELIGTITVATGATAGLATGDFL